MLTITTKDVVYTMSPDNSPVGRAKSGEQVRFETCDCFGNQITREDQVLGGIDWANINPATGPLYIEEAQPGDTLRVDIQRIELADQAVMTNSPGHGVFGDDLDRETTKVIHIENGKARFNDKISLDLKPMVGVIGVAPAQGAVETGSPGAHGGNMDCKKIGEGTSLFLPVETPGALLAMGDLHAVMGDGEVSVCGAEIAGAVIVKVSVIKGERMPLPLLVTPKKAMTLFSAERFEDAAKGAAKAMLRLLTMTLPMDDQEAGMLLSAAGDLRVCQVVDPLATFRMEVSLDIFRAYGVSLV